ncbi:MAG TPA: DUF6542 domain-containing protein [Streptosporangiaceae bacterium]
MVRLTGRGAIVLMVAVFTVGVLMAGWLGSPAVAGVFFLAGGAAAAWYARPADLLLVAVSPPTLLCIVLVLVSGMTGSGGLALSAAEGTALTLAGAAPWLFAGTALSLIIAAARGLRGPAGAVRQSLNHPEPGAAPRRIRPDREETARPGANRA